MGSIGKMLATERKRRDIDIKDVERQTRIHVRYLLAIENDDWDALPGQAYVRAFVASYARFLGLDPEPLLREMTPSDAKSDRPITKRNSRWEKSTTQGKGRRKGAGNRLPLVIVLVGLIAFGFLLSLPQSERRASTPKAAKISKQTSTTSPPVVTTREDSSTVNESSPAEDRSTEEEEALAALDDEPSESAEGGASDEDSSSRKSSAKTSVKTSQSVKVRIVVRDGQKSWVRVVTDGRTAFQGILEGGQQREWSAQTKLFLRTGNAGGLRLFLNDERLPNLGEKDEIVDRIFSPKKKEDR